MSIYIKLTCTTSNALPFDKNSRYLQKNNTKEY